MPKKLVERVYSLILDYIHTEVPEETIGTENTSWISQGEGDTGTIAIRATGHRIDDLVKDAVNYAYQELSFSTQTKHPIPMSPEIGWLVVEKNKERYSVSIRKESMSAPYIIKITRAI